MRYATGHRSSPRHGKARHDGRAPAFQVIVQINLRYLDYLVGDSALASVKVRELFGAWRSLEPRAQLRIAHMPFLLADLHFDDVAWWASWAEERGAAGAVPEVRPSHTVAIEMTRHVLITAWHLAQLRQFTAFPVGIGASVASTLSSLAPHELDEIAAKAYPDLTPRWAECSHFWSALFTAARDENEGRLAELQIHALRLLQHERFDPTKSVS